MPSLNNDNSVQINVSTTADTTGITESEKGLQSLGKTSDTVGKQASNMSVSFAKGMKKVSIATAVVGAGLTLYAKSATDYYVGMVKNSKALATQTGMTIEQSSSLLAVMERLGLSTASTSTAFRTFSKQIVDASDANSQAALKTENLNNQIAAAKRSIEQLTDAHNKGTLSTTDYDIQVEALNIKLKTYQQNLADSSSVLDQLGVKTTDATGKTRDFNSILLDVADKFHSMPDGAKKTSDAVALFGRSGTAMVKVLNLGSKGIQDLEAKAKSLGLTLTANNIVAVNKYIQSQKDLADSSNALKMQVGELTTPVLTNLNLAVNRVATAFLSTSSPIRGITANILAFGGPVAGATSAVTAFASNLATSVQAVGGFKNAAAGLTSFMTGPWGIAIGALSFAVTVGTSLIFDQASKTNELRAAQQNLKTATDALKTSQDNLSHAYLDQTGAQLGVEQAQNDYNTAVANFGPSSFEARQAAYQLQVAQENLKTANNNTKDALDKLHAKEQEVANDQSLIQHLHAISDSNEQVTRSADGAVTAISSLNRQQLSPTAQKIINSGTNSAGSKIDLSPLLKRAGGGPVNAGQGYIVGDNPDGSLNKTSELFVPNQSGTIIPANKVQSALSGAKTSIQNIFNIYNEVDMDRAISILSWKLAAK